MITLNFYEPISLTIFEKINIFIMKTCTYCKQTLELKEFHLNQSKCKSCRIELGRTPHSVVSSILKAQKRSSKRRSHNPPEYTKEELKEWVFKQPNWQKLYNEWVESGYKTEEKPSIDRIDNSKGYYFENIRLMKWKTNNKLGREARRRRVTNGVKIYESVTAAAIDLGLANTTNINRSITTGIKCGGFNWKEV